MQALIVGNQAADFGHATCLLWRVPVKSLERCEFIMDSPMVDDIGSDQIPIMNGEAQAGHSDAARVIGLNVRVVDFLSGYSVAGILDTFTPGEVRIALDEVIPEQRLVTVRFDLFEFAGKPFIAGRRNTGTRRISRLTIPRMACEKSRASQ